LGDSLNLLDLDKDGELTVAELKGAIKKILKRTITEDEAQEIVMLIDKDNDGKGKEENDGEQECVCVYVCVCMCVIERIWMLDIKN
jgi:EF-hand domain pair